MKKWSVAVLLVFAWALCASPFGCGKKSDRVEGGDAGPGDVVDADSDVDEPDTGGQRCGDVTCSGHGVCTESMGAVTCQCDLGYTGDDCSACAEGTRKDLDGSCTRLAAVDLQAAEDWCDEIVEITCSNIMNCCSGQDIGILQNLLTSNLMPDYWRNGNNGLSGITSNALLWKNTADCAKDLNLTCQNNYDWLYYALAMGTMTVDLAAANACLAEFLAPAGVCYKVGAMLDSDGLCDWSKILIGQQGVGEECHNWVRVAPPKATTIFVVRAPIGGNDWTLGDWECANVEGGPELMCGREGVCYARRQEGESCGAAAVDLDVDADAEVVPAVVDGDVDGDADGDIRSCEDGLVCSGRPDEQICRRLGALNEPCYPWQFNYNSEGCAAGLVCDSWSVVDTVTTPGTCIDISPEMPYAAAGEACRGEGLGVQLRPPMLPIDCIAWCEPGLACALGTCSDDPLRECDQNDDCRSHGRCATLGWKCHADCDCKRCSVTSKGCSDDYDCGYMMPGSGDPDNDPVYRRGRVCDNNAPLTDAGAAKFECVDPATDCEKVCSVTRDLCATAGSACDPAGVCAHSQEQSCATASDCKVCSNSPTLDCSDGNTDGLADNCPRRCVGNPSLKCDDDTYCRKIEPGCWYTNDACAGYCGGALLEHGTYGCATAADCYRCSLSHDPCRTNADCPRNQGDTEENKCLSEGIPCVTDDTCEPAPTCVSGTCLANSCTGAAACVDDLCVAESCGPNDEGELPATCQNRKCVDGSAYHVGYCGAGADIVNPGYYDMVYY